MNELIIFCGVYLIYISVFYAVLHVFLKHEKKHHVRHIITILVTAVFAWIVGHVLKGVIAHPRPDSISALIIPDDVYSFPSGHATFMFALAMSMLSFDRKAGRIILLMAVVTGVARVLAGVHFWYDIVGGFILGACIAYFVTLITKRFRD